MNRKNHLQIFLIFFLLAFLSIYASNNKLLVNINKICVQPEKLNTKIVLETSSPLLISETYYSDRTPSTIVVNLNNVKTENEPQIVLEESSLIKDIKIEKNKPDNLSLLIGLKERVPYRIYSDKKSTVIELNSIQRNQKGYLFDPEIKEKLTKRTKNDIFLKNIDISENKDRINISAKLSGKAISQVFALDNPSRLVIDLFDTFYLDANSTHPIKKMGIKNVRMAQFQMSNPYTITRIVFDMDEPKFYALNSEKDELIISFFKDDKPRNTPIIASSAPLIPEPNLPEEKLPPIAPAVKQKEKQSKEMPLTEKIELPEQLLQTKPLEMSTKKEEPKNLNPPSDKNHTSQPSPSKENKSENHIQQESQIEPRPIIEAKEKYSGEILSLKFKDADMRDVILYLGDFAGLNVVFDPDARGVVTCNLEDVPWDQALDIVLKINKMGKEIEGNVLRIAPIAALTREATEQRNLKESKELKEDLITIPYTLSYSKAKDVKDLLNSKLSTRGEIIIDERTNTLIMTDVQDRITLLEHLISIFDTPTPQVSIEARIVEATSTFVRNLGVQWGFRGIADPFYGNQTSLQFPHKIQADGALIPAGVVTKGISGPLGGYAINLPAPSFSTAVGISFGNILDTFRIDMAISALETSGQGRIISAPTITTLNNQEAEILQGRQIPVQTVANFTVTTTYRNAALELRATPQITAEGTIIMKIDIRNNAADFANLVNGIPPITIQTAEATVMIPDGGTTVIGGIYRTEDSITREKVPLLHKIPILGNLFRSFARTRQNRELLIFITPRIIK